MKKHNSPTAGGGGTETAPIFVTQAEAAKALGVSENTLKSWHDCPKVFIGSNRSRSSGRRVRYNLPEVITWLRDTRSAAQATRKEVAR